MRTESGEFDELDPSESGNGHRQELLDNLFLPVMGKQFVNEEELGDLGFKFFDEIDGFLDKKVGAAIQETCMDLAMGGEPKRENVGIVDLWDGAYRISVIDDRVRLPLRQVIVSTNPESLGIEGLTNDKDTIVYVTVITSEFFYFKEEENLWCVEVVSDAAGNKQGELLLNANKLIDASFDERYEQAVIGFMTNQTSEGAKQKVFVKQEIDIDGKSVDEICHYVRDNDEWELSSRYITGNSEDTDKEIGEFKVDIKYAYNSIHMAYNMLTDKNGRWFIEDLFAIKDPNTFDIYEALDGQERFGLLRDTNLIKMLELRLKLSDDERIEEALVGVERGPLMRATVLGEEDKEGVENHLLAQADNILMVSMVPDKPDGYDAWFILLDPERQVIMIVNGYEALILPPQQMIGEINVPLQKSSGFSKN
jgi:hypothetical protein